MAFKVIIISALLAVAASEGPYLGVPRLGLGVPFKLDAQVVGGSEAKQGAHPYQVTLQWGWIFGDSHFCGGSILTDTWIVTAGHCVHAVPDYGNFWAIAGKHNLKQSESSEQKIKVVKSIIHEKYVGGVAPYDIALLKLERPLKFNNNVGVIGLPKAGSIPSGNVVLSGWGSTSRTSSPTMPDKLQSVRLPYVDLVTCKRAVESIAGPSPLHETNVCTGPLTGGFSACSGDSGGPLANVDGGQPVIEGIVSWGIIPCGTRGAPSVYVRVSAFIDWINDTIAKN